MLLKAIPIKILCPLLYFFLFPIALVTQAIGATDRMIDCKAIAISLVPPEVTALEYDLPHVKIASLVDPTRSTGATVIYFPNGAVANFDARGGSVAAVETTLLEEGSYGDNSINALVFAGGSTMGLAAADGVRGYLFDKNIQHSTEFDFIPSVPGAVVFDYGGRVLSSNHKTIYPDSKFGAELMNHLSPDRFMMGRTGAGVTTTVNKIGVPYWGGQGAAFKSFRWGKLMAIVVLNASGNVMIDGKSLFPPSENEGDKRRAISGQNTTLSAIITDVALDRSQLKRLSMMVHTNMAQRIVPFQTPYDGDINFAMSLRERSVTKLEEEQLLDEAVILMHKAIENSIYAANRHSIGHRKGS